MCYTIVVRKADSGPKLGVGAYVGEYLVQAWDVRTIHREREVGVVKHVVPKLMHL